MCANVIFLRDKSRNLELARKRVSLLIYLKKKETSMNEFIFLIK